MLSGSYVAQLFTKAAQLSQQLPRACSSERGHPALQSTSASILQAAKFCSNSRLFAPGTDSGPQQSSSSSAGHFAAGCVDACVGHPHAVWRCTATVALQTQTSSLHHAAAFCSAQAAAADAHSDPEPAKASDSTHSSFGHQQASYPSDKHAGNVAMNASGATSPQPSLRRIFIVDAEEKNMDSAWSISQAAWRIAAGIHPPEAAPQQMLKPAQHAEQAKNVLDKAMQHKASARAALADQSLLQKDMLAETAWSHSFNVQPRYVLFLWLSSNIMHNTGVVTSLGNILGNVSQ